jgi:hypothetical protein
MSAWWRRGREEIEVFLRSHDIDPKRRGETLTIDEFITLTKALIDLGPRPQSADC